MIKRIKGNKYFIIFYMIETFFIFFWIFWLCFFLCSQLNPFIQYTNSLSDEYTYIKTPISSYKKEIPNSTMNSACLYYYDYIEDDGIYYIHLHINKEASEYGVVSLIGISLVRLDIKVPLEEGVIYTNNSNFKNNDKYLYKDYIEKINVDNIIFNEKIEVDFLSLDDSITFSDASFVVLSGENTLSTLSQFNSNIVTGFVFSGKGFKKFILGEYKLYTSLIILLTILPLIASILTFYNTTKFYLNKNKNNNYINYIYYTPLKKSVNIYFFENIVYTIPVVVVSIVVAYFFSKVGSILVLKNALLLGVGFYVISIRVVMKILLKNQYKVFSGGKLND